MSSKRLPIKEEDALFIGSLIELYLPSETKIRASYHRSKKGYTAIRFYGTIRGKEWFVDCYKGPFFIIQVPGFEAVAATEPLSMIAQAVVFLTSIQ